MAIVGSTSVTLSFKCTKLADTDVMSKSDPILVLFDLTSGRSVQVGRTECVRNQLNPVFKTTMQVQYFFERKQSFEVRVYDSDDGISNLADDDMLGTAQFTLGQVMGSRGHVKEFPLSKAGTVTVIGTEEGSFGDDSVVLSFRGSKLTQMDTFSGSDAFFKLARIRATDEFDLYQSEVKDNTLDPVWAPTRSLRVADVTGPHTDEPCIRFRCFDEDATENEQMGMFDLTFNDILRARAQEVGPFKLKSQKGKDKFYGDVFLANAKLTHYPSFLEYLNAGLQLNLNVAIDFTGSNGDPRQTTSLHYMSPQQPNQYVRAIMSVGDVLMDYDTDKQIPTYGFGAMLPNRQTSHCFNVNFQPQPTVAGVQGVLNAYGACLPQIALSGPTNFSPVIEQAKRSAAASPNTYTVLLILTDGEITDIDDTIASIVGADRTPLSIIIVGVGSCDFQAMNQLDGDGQRLMSRGRRAERDLVQFVPFRDYDRAPREALAAAVLQELPKQVTAWARVTNYRPDLATTA